MNDLKGNITEIRKYSRDLVREWNVLKGVFADTGCTFTQCHVLYELNKAGSLNMQELAAVLLLDKSTTSRVVKKLTDIEAISISKVPEDQRQKMLSLTKKGKSMVDRNNSKANLQVEEALKLLKEEEQEKALSGLKLYAKALQRHRQQKDFRFRKVKKKDNPMVARIIRQVMTEFSAVGPGYSIEDPEVDHIYDAYKSNRSVFYVISKGDTLLGCGGIGPLVGGNNNTCELKKMYFMPAARGMGLGTKMVQLLLAEARKIGYKKCYLETIERMWQANLLYKKTGFKKLTGAMGNTGHSACELWYAIDL